MKYTLLELTQAVLSSMDSDEINSINDSPESLQVVEVIKTVYDDIITRGDLTTNKILFNLDASGDVTKPVLMTKPSNIDKIEWLKYNTQDADDTTPVWNLMTYLPVLDFIDYIHSYNQDEDNIDSFDYVTSGFNFRFTYRTDTAPQYFTSFDDNTIIFDAHDIDVDTTLQSIKTLGYGSKSSAFTKSDSFVPDLQPQQFALLLNEAKSLAWAELKQTVHAKAERTAIKNWQHLQRTRQQTPSSQVFQNANHNFNRLPNFARPR